MLFWPLCLIFFHHKISSNQRYEFLKCCTWLVTTCPLESSLPSSICRVMAFPSSQREGKFVCFSVHSERIFIHFLDLVTLNHYSSKVISYCFLPPRLPLAQDTISKPVLLSISCEVRSNRHPLLCLKIFSLNLVSLGVTVGLYPVCQMSLVPLLFIKSKKQNKKKWLHWVSH